MDFHGNGVHHIGYGHPRLKRAIVRQLDDLPFVRRRFTCDVAVALAEKLGAITPHGLEKVLLATGGTDAVEIALKVARAATGRFKTVSFWESFHGADSVPAALAESSCSARVLSVRFFRERNTWPLLPVIAAPTGTRISTGAPS